jgi:hypothetical protein
MGIARRLGIEDRLPDYPHNPHSAHLKLCRAGNDANVFTQVVHLKLLVGQSTQVLRHAQDCENLIFEFTALIMSNLIEIQEAIERLAPRERAELWEWFQAQEVEETDEMLAAVDEGIRSIEEQGGTPAEEVRKLIPKWITK